jgi:endonuclease/exonuclease/phosphatase (EEP) superfamily protein YafD
MLLDRLFFKGLLVTEFLWDSIPVVVINTHLLANFAGDWEQHGMYARVEAKQLWQLAETVQSQPADSVILVVGDFNIPRGSKLYQDFMAHSGLTDPLAGDTRPTLRLPPGTPSRFSLPIDYVLVRLPDKYRFKMDCDLCFSRQYQINRTYQGYLSDHHGIELHMAIP